MSLYPTLLTRYWGSVFIDLCREKNMICEKGRGLCPYQKGLGGVGHSRKITGKGSAEKRKSPRKLIKRRLGEGGKEEVSSREEHAHYRGTCRRRYERATVLRPKRVVEGQNQSHFRDCTGWRENGTPQMMKGSAGKGKRNSRPDLLPSSEAPTNPRKNT